MPSVRIHSAASSFVHEERLRTIMRRSARSSFPTKICTRTSPLQNDVVRSLSGHYNYQKFLALPLCASENENTPAAGNTRDVEGPSAL